ncbi:Uncharacterised protein [Bordetella pertussis]|nr:Uncharacterised protein [Bordetella pertussis]
MRNSSRGISASDFRPALTTTKLWSTRTTSALMTSPDFMSWLLRLSANRSAKFSPPRMAEVETEDIRLESIWPGLAVQNTPQRIARSSGVVEPAGFACPCGVSRGGWRLAVRASNRY